MGIALSSMSECDSYSYFNVSAMRLPWQVGSHVQVAAYGSTNSSCIQTNSSNIDAFIQVEQAGPVHQRVLEPLKQRKTFCIVREWSLTYLCTSTDAT